MGKVEKQVRALVAPIVEEEGLELWDVEYVREAGQYYLRIYLDSPSGITIDDCERVSRRVDPLLDEADPVPDSYIFEVSSAGIERALKRPSDFLRFLGSKAELRFYAPINGARSVVGVLQSYDEQTGAVTIDGVTYERDRIADARLRSDDI